jgi:sugar O-acyltransferase (sialic acid O-acetyltransferase NeuD family)
MVKQIFLIGGGGHGRVVLDALLSSGVNVAGVLDPQLKIGDQLFEVQVRGNDDFLHRLAPTEASPVNGLGANPCVGRRTKLFEELKSRGFSFVAVRHPSAWIGRECVLGEGSQLMAGVVLQNRVRIGDNAVVNTRASVDHDCAIGTHAFVAPGVVLGGNVIVGDSVFIGAGAIVLPGIEIGAATVIGAGSIVVASIPGGWVVAGNPAVKIRKIKK